MATAIILARGGSKRLPNKNTKIFGGKPLIAWTIDAAQGAGCIDKVIVSTDSAFIANIAFIEWAQIHHRSEDNSEDRATSYEALSEVINDFGIYPLEDIILLQPTSPLRTAEDIDAAYDKYLEEARGQGLISVEQGRKEGNGAIYIAAGGDLDSPGFTWDSEMAARYEMPASRSHDIDTLEDFKKAELDIPK